MTVEIFGKNKLVLVRSKSFNIKFFQKSRCGCALVISVKSCQSIFTVAKIKHQNQISLFIWTQYRIDYIRN